MRVARAATALTACALVGTLLTSTAGGAAPGTRDSRSSSPPTPEGGPAQSVSAEERQAAEPRPLLELVSWGGSGRLYTLDHAEASAAVSDRGMQLQPGRVGYVPATGVEGTRPMFRLKPRPDATAWLFTTSTDERDGLVAQGWVAEGVAAHVYRDAGPGRELLLRFTNGREWRLAVESRSPRLQSAGYRVDGPLGYVYPTWIRAGAIYFGMFHAGGHETIIRRTEDVYGRSGDWWGGVRDFHDGHENANQWPGEDWSSLQPSIGYYDDSRPETLEQHITQAASAGLSYFSFYWYWDTGSQGERVSGPALDAFLQARNRNAIDFNVSICAHPWDSLRIPESDYGAVSRLLVDEYLSQANTLRTNDGRKIVTLCDTRGFGDGSVAQVRRFVDMLRRQARQSLGEEIYVMVNQVALSPGRIPEAGGDAAFCATDHPAVEAGSYSRYVSGQRAFYQQAPGAYGRCVVSDFDERPRYPIEQTNPAAIRWFPDQSIDLFRRAVRNAREDVVASTRPQTVDNLVLFYAWNEWHEGGIIEPNARDGCAYLDAIRQELGLVGGSGCTPGAPPPSTTMTAPPTPASPGGSSATTAVGSTSTPSTSASGREVAARRETGDDLPDTGSDLTLPLVGVGAALLATGTGTVLGVRHLRRRLAD